MSGVNLYQLILTVAGSLFVGLFLGRRSAVRADVRGCCDRAEASLKDLEEFVLEITKTKISEHELELKIDRDVTVLEHRLNQLRDRTGYRLKQHDENLVALRSIYFDLSDSAGSLTPEAVVGRVWAITAEIREELEDFYTSYYSLSKYPKVRQFLQWLDSCYSSIMTAFFIDFSCSVSLRFIPHRVGNLSTYPVRF